MLYKFIISLTLIFSQNTFSQKTLERLPVELVYFEANKLESSVLILFGTATEINNYGFDIERADEFRSWEKIGFVPGHGTIYSPHDYTFEDTSYLNDGIYFYRLKQIDTDGNFTYSHEDTIYVQQTTSVEEVEIPQPEFQLFQNYPNPFNSLTTITFDLSVKAQVKLSVYDLSGKIFIRLIEDELPAGNYKISFFPENTGTLISSGILFFKLEAGNLFQIKKMIYLK